MSQFLKQVNTINHLSSWGWLDCYAAYSSPNISGPSMIATSVLMGLARLLRSPQFTQHLRTKHDCYIMDVWILAQAGIETPSTHWLTTTLIAQASRANGEIEFPNIFWTNSKEGEEWSGILMFCSHRPADKHVFITVKYLYGFAVRTIVQVLYFTVCIVWTEPCYFCNFRQSRMNRMESNRSIRFSIFLFSVAVILLPTST